MDNVLVPVKENAVIAMFSDGGLDPLLAEIAKVAKAHVPIIETAAGRKDIASNAYKVAQSKTAIDNVGKALTADKKKEIKKVDDARKAAREFLDDLKVEVRQPLTDWEDEQKAAEEAAQKQRELEAAWDEAIAENDLINREKAAKEREAMLAEKEAELAQREADRLADIEADRLKKEKAAEKERLAKEQAEREERLKKEAAEKAEREAEEAARKAEEDKKRAVAEAEARVKREAEEKERLRLEAEAAEKEKAEKIARNKAHRKKINREALACFEQNGYDEATAEPIIELIASGAIDHITINY